MKWFESKLTHHFQENLKIYLPKDMLKLCETPNELIEYVGQTKEVLRLQETDRNEVYVQNNGNIYKRATPAYVYLANFIMNRVPSDIYRLKNP